MTADRQKEERERFEAWAATEWPNGNPPDSAWIGWLGRSALAAADAKGEVVEEAMRLADLSLTAYMDWHHAEGRADEAELWDRHLANVEALRSFLAAHLPAAPTPAAQQEVSAYVTEIAEGKTLMLPRASLNTDGLVPVFAAPAAQQAQGWRPIEEAPKDGTELLLVDDEGIRVVGRWSKHNHVPLYGWVRQVELYGEEVDGFDAVAYQPLPSPPAQPAGKEATDA